VLLRADAGVLRPREAITLLGGVVGYQLPPLRPASLPASPGDVLIMITDGIGSGFLDGLEPRGDVGEIARGVLERHGKATDDALVLVARFRSDAQ
jgi:negative regulator of sigma-B (phosphoserine phosphatase)